MYCNTRATSTGHRVYKSGIKAWITHLAVHVTEGEKVSCNKTTCIRRGKRVARFGEYACSILMHSWRAMYLTILLAITRSPSDDVSEIRSVAASTKMIKLQVIL